MVVLFSLHIERQVRLTMIGATAAVMVGCSSPTYIMGDSDTGGALDGDSDEASSRLSNSAGLGVAHPGGAGGSTRSAVMEQGGSAGSGCTHTGGAYCSESVLAGGTSGGNSTSAHYGGTTNSRSGEGAGANTIVPAGGSLSDGGSTAGAWTDRGGAVSTGGARLMGGSNSSGDLPNTGGVRATGGAATSGTAASAAVTGGAMSQATGGAMSSSASQATGGSMSSSSNKALGGASSAGGTSSTGGTPSTSAARATGGSSGSGVYCSAFTDLGTLASASNHAQSVPTAGGCFRFTVASDREMFRGMQMSNCDVRTASINGTASGCVPGTSCSVSVSVPKAADGYWYVSFAAGTSSNCTSSWWWW